MTLSQELKRYKEAPRKLEAKSLLKQYGLNFRLLYEPYEGSK